MATWEEFVRKVWRSEHDKEEPNPTWMAKQEDNRWKWKAVCGEQWLAAFALVEFSLLADWETEKSELPQLYAKSNDQSRA